MRKAPLLFLGLAGLAVVEIVLITLVAGQIGIGWTLLLLLATAVLGGVLWRREGSRALASLRDAQQHPDEVGKRVTDTALVFVGGLLLMAPGFISDVVGLIFLLPPTRPLARRGVSMMLAAMTRKYRDQADLLEARLRPDTVVPGEAVQPPEAPPRRPRPDDPTVIKGEIES